VRKKARGAPVKERDSKANGILSAATKWAQIMSRVHFFLRGVAIPMVKKTPFLSKVSEILP
jgi:hypothetical protein